MGQESGLGSPGPSLQGPHTRLQSRCWSGLWVHRGSSAEGHASGLRVVGCARSTWAVGRPAGLSLLPLPPVACSSLLSRRLVSFSQPGSVSPRRLTEHAHTYPRLPRHLTHNSREDVPTKFLILSHPDLLFPPVLITMKDTTTYSPWLLKPPILEGTLSFSL